MHAVLWKRVNQEGHDACRFTKTGDVWMIEGTAVFRHAAQAASLGYRLVCDGQWASRQASIAGWIGSAAFQMEIARDIDGDWRINGSKNRALSGLKDIDLGFTPASNTNAIRRLGLSLGDESDSVAVWLDTEDWTVKPLRQSYRRTDTHAFTYTSPQHGYRATLAVDDFGAVTVYPGLWVMLTPSIS